MDPFPSLSLFTPLPPSAGALLNTMCFFCCGESAASAPDAVQKTSLSGYRIRAEQSVTLPTERPGKDAPDHPQQDASTATSI